MCAAVAPFVIGSLSGSLTPELVKAFVEKYGPKAVMLAQGMYVQWQSGKAATQQTHTMKEIQDLVSKLHKIIEPKEIRVVADAFNSAPEFITYFQCAALGAIPLAILHASDTIRRFGASLEAIRSELAIANVANVQGWGDGGFGSYVHRFVRNEMAAFDGTRGEQDENPHYFYVWHPDNDWHIAFEERQAVSPLGTNFGGYHHELPTLCLRMRADREALRATATHGDTAVVHLVIPTYQPLAVDTRFSFAEELFPLIVTGSRHRGTDLVWLALYQRQRAGRFELNFISILPDKRKEVFELWVKGFVGSWLIAAGCTVAVAIFPAFIPVPNVVIPSVEGGLFATGVGGAGSMMYDTMAPADIVLGNALFLVQPD